MASITPLTSGFDGSGTATSVTTASVTLAANKLGLIYVVNIDASFDADATQPTISGWTVVVSTNFGSAPGSRSTVFRRLATTPVTATITIDFGGVAQYFIVYSVCEWEGVPTSGTNGADAVVQSVLTSGGPSTMALATLAALESTLHSVYGAMIHFGSGFDFTPGSGFTTIHLVTVDGGVSDSFLTEHSINDVTVDAPITGSTTWHAAALEIRDVITPQVPTVVRQAVQRAASW